MARFERTHWREQAIALARQGKSLTAISKIVQRDFTVVYKALPPEVLAIMRKKDEPKRFKDLTPVVRWSRKSPTVNFTLTLSSGDFEIFKDRARAHDVSIAYLIRMCATAMLDEKFPVDKLPVSLSETYPYVERD